MQQFKSEGRLLVEFPLFRAGQSFFSWLDEARTHLEGNCFTENILISVFTSCKKYLQRKSVFDQMAGSHGLAKLTQINLLKVLLQDSSRR